MSAWCARDCPTRPSSGSRIARRQLAARLPQLDAVTFQDQLGSIGDKVRRVAALARDDRHAHRWRCRIWPRAQPQLAKCDLVTNLVGEFPELQGLMGTLLRDRRRRSRRGGRSHRRALPAARRGRYSCLRPRAGLAVALADRFDTLTGIFAIGQKPSGTKDPFALRRAAIGVLRMMVEKRLPLNHGGADRQPACVRTRCSSRPAPQARAGRRATAVAREVYDYIMERLRSVYLEPADAARCRASTTEAFDAVLATQPRSPLDFDARLRALLGFLALPEAASLTAANRRIANLLKKSAGGECRQPPTIDTAAFRVDAERHCSPGRAGGSIRCRVTSPPAEYAAAFDGAGATAARGRHLLR